MEQNTLALTCSAPNARPIKVTPAMARLAAEKVANALVKGPMHGDRMDAGELVDDIMQVWKSKGELDGYKLGKELDRHCSWDCDLDVAEELDTFSSLCRDELSRAETLWGAENPIDPPFPVGTIVKTRHGEGPIEKVHEYGPAKYVVGIGGIHAIINFEDCQAVDVDSDIAAEVAAVEATLGDGR